jgi:hypothetical protein
METLKKILNAIWQNKVIRTQIRNVISATITLLLVYLTNLQDKVSNEALIQLIILGTVIIQQGLKYLNKLFFNDVGVEKLPAPTPEIINASNFDTGESGTTTIHRNGQVFVPKVLRPNKVWKKPETES